MVEPLLGEEKNVKKITFQEQVPLYLFSACWERKKNCWNSFLRLKGYFFLFYQEHQPRRSLVIYKVFYVFTLNVGSFS